MAAANTIELRITATGAEQAARILQSVATAGADVGKVTTVGAAQAATALNAARGASDAFGGSLRRIAEIATGVSFANLFESVVSGALRAGVALVKLGLETQRQEDAFGRLTTSLGVNGAALATALEHASRGLADASDVMTTSALALQEGLRPEQLVKTMEIATAQSKLMGTTVTDAFNQITQAILAQQERGLKTAGVYVDMTGALDAHARSLGVTTDRLTEAERIQVLYNEVVATTSHTVATLNGELLTNAQQVEKLGTAWQNTQETIGKNLVDMGAAVAGWAATSATAIESVAQRLRGFRESIEDFFIARKDTLVGGLVAPWIEAGRASRDAAAPMNEAAAAAVSLGTNSAAAGPKIRDTATSIKAAADEAARAARVLEEDMRRALEQNVAGWVRYAEAVFDATEEAQRAEIAILDAAVALEKTMLDAHTAGWVAYAQAVLDATEMEQLAEVAITNRAQAQEEALRKQGDAGWVAYAEAVFAATEAEQLAEVAITDRARAIEEAFSSSRLRAIEGWFLSITDTFSKMADGLIAGTLSIGDAFANLGRNLLTNFVQLVIHQVFDPVLKAAASFVSSLISMLAGRAGVSLTGGLLGLVASLFGGGGAAAGTSATQTAGTLAVLAGDVSGSYASPGGSSTFSSLSNVASGLSTLYTAVAKFSGLPQISTLVGTGVEAILSAAGLLGPGFVSLASSLSAVVAGIQTGTLSISAAFGFGAPAVSSAVPAVTGAGAGASSFAGAGAGAWAGGASIASLYAFAIVGSLLEMLSIEERKFRRRQKDIQDEAFAVAASDQLSALEQGGKLTADIAGTLSVLGRMAAIVQNLAPLRTGEAWDIQEGANLGPGGITGAAIGMPGVGSREEAMAAAAASVQYITPFLESLAQLGIAQFQGEILPEQWAKADVAGGGFEAYINRWTAALKPYVAAVIQATAGTEGLTGEERDRALALNTLRAQAALTATGINQVSQALGVLPQQVPDFAAMLDEGQIRETAQIMTDRLFQSVHQAFMAEPVKIVQLLDIDALAREGEEAGDTILRLATALQGLDDMTTRLRDTAEDVRGETDLPARVARNVADLQKTLDAAWGTFTSTLDPSVMLAAAETIEQATIARYQVEIDAANHLLGVIRGIAEGITATANTIASNAPFLRQIGIDIRGATTSMIAFARSLPDAGARITALGGAVNLFLAQMRGALTGGAAAEQPLSAADYEAGIQAILHPPAGSAGDMRSAAEIIEAEIQKLRLTIEGPRDVGRVQAEIAAMQAKLPALEAFIAQQEAARGGAIGAGGMTAGEKLLELVPNAQDLLQGIREGFSSALELIDPAERAGALNEVFSLLASGVGQIEQLLTQSGLSAADQAAVLEQVLGAVGPLGEEIYAAMIAAAGEQAKAATAAADQLKEIIGPDYANAQNFIAARTGEMAEALTGLADKIITGFEGIIGTEMAGIITAITAIPPPVVNVTVSATSAQGGMAYVRAGLYQLHEGERVLDPHTAARSRSYTPRGDGGAGGSAPVTVTLQFGDVRVGSGGKDGAREFMDALRDEIRYGDLGAVITKRVTGKG